MSIDYKASDDWKVSTISALSHAFSAHKVNAVMSKK